MSIVTSSEVAADLASEAAGVIVRIGLSKIKPDPNQPRRTFDEYELGSLAESIKEVGQLSPVQVSWNEKLKSYVLIFGERRWRAAKIAGLKTLKCEVVSAIDPHQVKVRQLIENRQREAVKPVQEALAMAELLVRSGWSASKLACAMGCTSSTITKVLALAKLEPKVQLLIEEGSLTPSAGYELGRVKEGRCQIALAEDAVAGHWGRDEIARAVTAYLAAKRDDLAGQAVLPKAEKQEEEEEKALIRPTATFSRGEKEEEEGSEEFPGEKVEAPEHDAFAWRPEHRYRFEPIPGCMVQVVMSCEPDHVRASIFAALTAISTEVSEWTEKGPRLPPGL